MSEMIKRVARALCWANQMDPDSKSHINGNAWLWEDYAKDARAAMEAMRELTPEMTAHLQMNTEMGAYVCANWIGGYSVMGEYQSAMIDAALKEKPRT